MPIISTHNENDNQEESSVSSSSCEESLVANYVVETHTYRTAMSSCNSKNREERSHFKEESSDGTTIRVNIKAATTTKGRNVITSTKDSSGIMIWPASHLLCQFLAFYFSQPFIMNGRSSPTTTTTSNNNNNNYEQLNNNTNNTQNNKIPNLGNKICELGCGCGIVSITAALAAQQQQQRLLNREEEAAPDLIMIATDMDQSVVTLCQENMTLNGLQQQTCQEENWNDAIDKAPPNNQQQSKGGALSITAQTLKWGDTLRTLHLLSKAASVSKDECHLFDTVLAADVVYPATSTDALLALFQTATLLLKSDGCFLLSFVTRDGPYKTPMKLLNAATDAGYCIDIIDNMEFITPCFCQCEKEQNEWMSSLLGAKLLILTRATTTTNMECDNDDMANKKRIAKTHNDLLGYQNCAIFPGMRDAIIIAAKAQEKESVEEWTAPFDNSYSSSSASLSSNNGETQEYNNGTTLSSAIDNSVLFFG